MFRRILLSATVLFFLSCGSQKLLLQSDDQLKTSLKKHISTLASDKFEGRETGTEGETMASGYITKEFKKNKLKPKGETSFLQEFKFTAGAETGPGTQL